ncbi:MAG: hypothetical protein ACLGHN_02515 [Bacteriovoracia bacterium]
MSSQIIAFTTRLEFKTLLDIECKTLTGFSPVVKDTVDDLSSLLGLFADIDILILDEPPVEKDYKFLLDAISVKEEDIKSIIILGNKNIDLKNSRFFPQQEVGSLIEHLKTLLTPVENASCQYISVPSDSLIHFKVLPFDLYVKIGENKYIKRIPANEDIEESTVEGFKAKGILELYFEKKFNRDFSLMLLNNMINKVEKQYTSESDKLKARSEVFSTTKEIVKSVGLPPRVVQVCESMMESISEDVLKGKDRLSNYLSQMKGQSHLNFSFRFVELTSFISTQILDAMEIPGKEEAIKKVVFAAFFCDISLSDEAQLDFRSEEGLRDLWPEDLKVVREHALKASQLVEKYKNAPEGAATIILQHHGSPQGIGFPSYSPDLLPLSRCLIGSQELAYALLKNPESTLGSVVSGVIESFKGTGIEEYLVVFKNSCESNL